MKNKPLYVAFFFFFIVSISSTIYFFLKTKSVDEELLKVVSDVELKNEIRKKNLMEILDSIKRFENSMDKELKDIVKNNKEIRERLSFYEKEYNKQKQIIKKLKEENDKIKINTPNNIDNWWK